MRARLETLPALPLPASTRVRALPEAQRAQCLPEFLSQCLDSKSSLISKGGGCWDAVTGIAHQYAVALVTGPQNGLGQKEPLNAA